MSRQDVEIVRRSFGAWNEGDVEAIRRIYTEDVLVAGGSGLGGSLGGGDPIGRWVADVREPWAEVRCDLERIFDGDGVVVGFIECSALAGAAASRWRVISPPSTASATG